MEIIVSGKQVSVGESLRKHIEEKLALSISKYIDRVNAIKVVLSKEGHAFRVDISGNIGTHAGLSLKSRTDGMDPYATFDAAAEKIEKQLRRYKRQITKHHSARNDKAEMQLMAGTQYVISSEESNEDVGDNPLVIAEQTTHIEHLTVSHAVMRMDLGELPALVFINEANNRINVLYRRTDGNISWVDPLLDEAKMVKAA